MDGETREFIQEMIEAEERLMANAQYQADRQDFVLAGEAQSEARILREWINKARRRWGRENDRVADFIARVKGESE